MLQKHIGTESAIGCLVFSLALTFFVSQKFAVLKAVQLAGPLFGNMVGKMTNTCEHQRVRRLRLQLRMSGAGAKLSKGLKGPEGSYSKKRIFGPKSCPVAGKRPAERPYGPFLGPRGPGVNFFPNIGKWGIQSGATIRSDHTALFRSI